MAQLTRDGPVVYVKVVQPGKTAERLDQSHRILSFEFQDNEHKADHLKLEVDNSDLSEFDSPVFRKGYVLEVTWGYEGAMAPTRSCVIQKVHGFQKLTVEAYAKSILMHKVTRVRRFQGLKRSQVAKQIAEEYGYATAAEQFIEDTKQAFETLHQARLTDAQFLARMAKQEGFVFFVDFDGFHFHQRDLRQRPRRVLHWYSDPNQGDVISVNVENDVSALAGSVVVKARDPIKRTTISETGGNSDTKRDVLAPALEVTVDQRTKTIKDNRSAAQTPCSAEVLMCPAPDLAVAKRVADARYRSAQQTVIKLKSNIVGDPRMLAKTIVEWRGLGKRLSGNYYVKAVTHKIGSDGYTCDLECRRDGHSEVGATKTAGKVNAQKAPEPSKTGIDGGPEPLVRTVMQRDKTITTVTAQYKGGGREDPVTMTSRQD